MTASPLVLVAGPKRASGVLSTVADALRTPDRRIATLLDGSLPTDCEDCSNVHAIIAFGQTCDAAMLGTASSLAAIIVPSLGLKRSTSTPPPGPV